MILFLDTNIFLHYRRFTEIDWLALTNEKSVVLAFPPVTIRELNEKKDGGGTSKTKKRAQSVLSDIDRLFSENLLTEVKKNVRAECITNDPIIDFVSLKLRSDLNDDWLIASTLERKISIGSLNRCAIVTADIGLKLKCRGHSIDVVQPSEADKLPEEEDSDAKKIRALENELLTFKSAAPVLSLSFAGENAVAKFKFIPQAPFDLVMANKHREEMENTITKIPLATAPEVFKSLTGKSVGTYFGGYDNADIVIYNQSVDVFISNYVANLKRIHDYNQLRERSFLLDIGLMNSGKIPAVDILIHMHFPHGFTLYSEKHFPQRPSKLTPPIKPQTFAEKIQKGMTSLSIARLPEFNIKTPPAMGDSDRGISIRRTNSYDVEVKVRKLNHGFTENVESLIFTLDDPNEPMSFGIDYTIHAGNIPIPTSGQLHVVVE